MQILGTNKNVIKNQDFNWNEVNDIDVSTINEQTFFKINNVNSPGYSGVVNGGTMIITRIEFLT